MNKMKKTGTCPKCGSIKMAGLLNNKVGTNYGNLYFLVSDWRTATYEAYTCMDCGYSEFYPDEKGLENIRKYYTYQE